MLQRSLESILPTSRPNLLPHTDLSSWDSLHINSRVPDTPCSETCFPSVRLRGASATAIASQCHRYGRADVVGKNDRGEGADNSEALIRVEQKTRASKEAAHDAASMGRQKYKGNK